MSRSDVKLLPLRTTLPTFQAEQDRSGQLCIFAGQATARAGRLVPSGHFFSSLKRRNLRCCPLLADGYRAAGFIRAKGGNSVTGTVSDRGKEKAGQRRLLDREAGTYRKKIYGGKQVARF
ncbi:MAG: hypothetical protein H0Z34_02365 [Brevibacillus sp.]|nr:hypothetical protein [Brevibacillus sp.]